MKVLVTDFSGIYAAEEFLPWLREKEGDSLLYRDFTALEGTACYCDPDARASIERSLPSPLPTLRWIDSGDYHYMSYLLSLQEDRPFHLVLLDHHPDTQEAAFGDMLSCGGWLTTLSRENPLLRSVLSIGPDGCGEEIPAGWMEQRRGERLYISLDKDIMDLPWARTDWTHGSFSFLQLKDLLDSLLSGHMELAAVDICGGISPSKGASPEDLRINKEINIELYNYFTNHLIQ